MTQAMEEPPPGARRALALRALEPADLQSILRCWNEAGRALLARPALSAQAREVIHCQRRLCRELEELIAGQGALAVKLSAAFAGGWPQGIAAVEPLQRSSFIHYLVSAPWNALTARDVPDLRATRGAGVALIEEAVRWSAARGQEGLVTLEAIDDRCRGVYQHLGFVRSSLWERPGALPAGLYSPAEARTRCWMQLDARRCGRFSALVCGGSRAA